MALGVVNSQPASQSKTAAPVQAKVVTPAGKAVVVAKADDSKGASPKAEAADAGTATPTPAKKAPKGK
jgi:hypothetical protein